ncbi:MAG: hypothetical protein ACE5HB_01660 [Terriglobia bacterium]
MRVAPPIWAGVIEVFWTFLNLGAAAVYLVGGYVAVAGAGVAGIAGGGADVERVAVWLLAGGFLALGVLSIQLPLAVGFFALKRWTYGLYLWTIGPIVLLPLVLQFTQPELLSKGSEKIPLGVSMLMTAAYVAGIALLISQFILVLKSKEHLVN